ncbi:hypothetical protein EV196_106185 [Mariniflexile fucanivorans]|uniref:Endonuclease n=1 Tax=Mariniflexile fucanivorans TaxID=264023 RepID=A0A4R1RG79_9FLAO|nr:hypothetical protein [Mariniflexile fucanivorans]TCL64994.1 hypothetical protein EV196_106185 [Mariniflexile fucanivorans]
MVVINETLNDYYVYVVSNCNRTEVCIYASNNLRNKLIKCYFDNLRCGLDCYQLVYYENFGKEEEDAMVRAKTLENMSFDEICKLIKRTNPECKTISDEIFSD